MHERGKQMLENPQFTVARTECNSFGESKVGRQAGKANCNRCLTGAVQKSREGHSELSDNDKSNNH